MRVTEEQLIAESVLLAEAWRDRLAERRLPPRCRAASLEPPRSRCSAAAIRCCRRCRRRPARRRAPTRRHGAAARRWRRFVARAARRNASAASRCSTRAAAPSSPPTSPSGACLDTLPEVRAALAGQYAAAARERADAARAPWSEVQRWLRVDCRSPPRCPCVVDDRVVGVVRMAQPSSSPLEAVWDHSRHRPARAARGRRSTCSASRSSSRARISRPVRAITAVAEAVAHGEPPQPFAPAGLVPARCAR